MERLIDSIFLIIFHDKNIANIDNFLTSDLSIFINSWRNISLNRTKKFEYLDSIRDTCITKNLVNKRMTRITGNTLETCVPEHSSSPST